MGILPEEGGILPEVVGAGAAGLGARTVPGRKVKVATSGREGGRQHQGMDPTPTRR